MGQKRRRQRDKMPGMEGIKVVLRRVTLDSEASSVTHEAKSNLKIYEHTISC